MSDEFKLDPKMDPMMMLAVTIQRQGVIINKLNNTLRLLAEKVQCMENNLTHNGYLTPTNEDEDEGDAEDPSPTAVPQSGPHHLRPTQGGEDDTGSDIP